jgi:hypothetical protein
MSKTIQIKHETWGLSIRIDSDGCTLSMPEGVSVSMSGDMPVKILPTKQVGMYAVERFDAKYWPTEPCRPIPGYTLMAGDGSLVYPGVPVVSYYEDDNHSVGGEYMAIFKEIQNDGLVTVDYLTTEPGCEMIESTGVNIKPEWILRRANVNTKLTDNITIHTRMALFHYLHNHHTHPDIDHVILYGESSEHIWSSRIGSILWERYAQPVWSINGQRGPKIVKQIIKDVVKSGGSGLHMIPHQGTCYLCGERVRLDTLVVHQYAVGGICGTFVMKLYRTIILVDNHRHVIHHSYLKRSFDRFCDTLDI